MALQTAESVPVRYGLPSERTMLSYNAHFEEDDERLPIDPRQWTRSHVAQWLNMVTLQNGLPEVPTTRFLMNGKALCLMTADMFLSRVPLGGKTLYRDFQLRLCAALNMQKRLQ